MELETYSPPDNNTRQLFRSLGGEDFDRMRTYLFEMHNSMQNQKHVLKQTYLEELKLFPNAKDLTTRIHTQYQENYDTHFVGLLLNSAHVASCSLFEITFKRICFYAARTKHIQINPDHFGKAGIIEKCKLFIEQEIKIDLSEIEQYWITMLMYRQVRNKITHSAILSPTNKPLIEFMNNQGYVHIYSHPETKDLTFFIRDRLFIYDFIDISSSYLIWILMRIEQPNKWETTET